MVSLEYLDFVDRLPLGELNIQMTKQPKADRIWSFASQEGKLPLEVVQCRPRPVNLYNRAYPTSRFNYAETSSLLLAEHDQRADVYWATTSLMRLA